MDKKQARHKTPVEQDPARLPHEPSCPNVRMVAAGVGTMAAGIVLALLGSWAALHFAASPAAAPNNAEPPRIEGPVQQTAPALEREALIAEKRARLSGRGAGGANAQPVVPIDEAMRAMAHQPPARGATQ